MIERGRAGAITAFGDRSTTARGVDGIQILKVVAAGVAAWWASRDITHSELIFLAPWTALMTVQATVLRSVRSGLQTLVAAALGVGISFVVVSPLGVNIPSVAMALTIGMVLSRLPWIRDEGVAVATTALFVMASHTQNNAGALVGRLLDVLVGVVIGVVVNMSVAPPLRDSQALRGTDEVTRRLGRLLVAMADDLDASWTTQHADAWIHRTVQLDDELDEVAAQVRLAQESNQWNLRRRVRPAPALERPLARLHEAVSHVRHVARTVSDSTYNQSEWDPEFRSRWTGALRSLGESVPSGSLEHTRDELDRLTTDMSREDLANLHWPVYGSLLTSLRNLTLVMDDGVGERRRLITGV